MADKKTMEIANEIVDSWMNAEAFEKLNIPSGRLWILKRQVAQAIMSERVKTIYLKSIVLALGERQPQNAQNR